MKVINEFTLTFQDNHPKIEENISRELYQKRRMIRQYKTGVQIISYDIYEMDEKNPDFKEIVSFAQKFPKEIKLKIWSRRLEYEEKEIEEAVAFIPDFANYLCEEYEDFSLEYEECPYCYARLADKERIVYIMPKGIVKTKANEYGVLDVNVVSDRPMVLPKLYEKLVDEGIPEKFFRPAVSKRKKILAYELVSDNRIPVGTYEDGNYSYKFKCGVCGTAHYVIDVSQYNYVPKTLSEEGISFLKDVNITEASYCGCPQILVSKKFYDLIKKYVPTAKFLPVFLRK